MGSNEKFENIHLSLCYIDRRIIICVRTVLYPPSTILKNVHFLHTTNELNIGFNCYRSLLPINWILLNAQYVCWSLTERNDTNNSAFSLQQTISTNQSWL